MNKLERLQQLTSQVASLANDYYVHDKPSVSDAEYDKLSDELIKLENELGVVLPASPTNRVGGEILEGFEKVVHAHPLLSLAKCQTLDELQNWVNSVKSAFPKAEFSVEHKFDGLSISLSYENGKLVLAATRGNGQVGENVTEQIKTIRSVPLEIPFNGKLVVVGEGIMLLTNLARFNKTSKEPLKNARNAAAGAIRNLDPKETAKRNLDFFAYHIPYCENSNFSSQQDINDFLKQNNFVIGQFFEIHSDFESIRNSIIKVGENRATLNYLIDGMVLKLNQIGHRDDFGKTSKFPKWAIAYKFEAEELSTTLKSINWNVGRTGKITPIAEIEPVELSGATVQHATLNNFSDILKKRVKLGGRVFVRRSNEVIPEILGVAGDENLGLVPTEPELCTSCGTELVRVGPNLFCKNYFDCPAQIVARFSHFASRDAINIEGLSDQTALMLFNKLGIRHFSQIYKLTTEDLLKLDGFKAKKAENLISAIQKSKNPTLNSFIYSLGISEIGVKASKDLAKKFGTFENFSKASYDEILAIFNFGEVMAQEITDYFAEKQFSEEIQKLLNEGVVIKEVLVSANKTLQGQKIVLTGTLLHFSRDEATKLIEDAGGEVVSSVSSKTSFVVVGENAGSKLDKAKELGISTYSEEKLLELIKK